MFRSIVMDDFMTTHLATAKPSMDLLSLVDLLLIQGISGAPVVDDDGKLIGMISEQDCLRVMTCVNTALSGKVDVVDEKEIKEWMEEPSAHAAAEK